MALPVDGHQAGGFEVRAARVVELAAKSRLPAIYSDDISYEAGGLMAYYPSGTDLDRGSASYIDKILKGANPADWPVGQPKKIDGLVKSLFGRLPGESRGPERLEITGFRLSPE